MPECFESGPCGGIIVARCYVLVVQVQVNPKALSFREQKKMEEGGKELKRRRRSMYEFDPVIKD